MYECVIYEYGTGIFNTNDKQKRYRQIVNEIGRVYFTQDDVYENKNVNK